MSFPSGTGTGTGTGAPSPFGGSFSASQNTPNVTFGGGSSATAGTASPFSQPSTATSKPGTSMFGGFTAGTNPSGTTQSSSIFGNSSKPGSGASTPAFGSNGAGNTQGGKPATSSPFTFGSLSNEKPAGSSGAQGSGLFPKLNSNPAPVSFGTLSNNASTSAPLGSTTPATTKSYNFGASTTPAGPPPSDNGQASKNPTSGLFANLGQSTGGGLGAQNSATGSGLKPPSFSNIFNSTPASVPATSSTTGASTTTAGNAKSGFSFPPIGLASSTSASQQQTTSTAPSIGIGTGTTSFADASKSKSASSTSNVFGGMAGGSTTTGPSTSIPSSTAAPNPFPSFIPSTPVTTQSTSTTAPPATTAASSFPGLGSGLGTSTAATSQNTSTTAPSSSSVFGSQPGTNSTTQASSSAPTQPSASGTTGNQTQQNSQPLGASTTGPTPQISRLKNKTMDEIITRWASDLLKYQKEFQDQATKVAAWDRLMVENGDKIQKLYSSTWDAAKASTEVERQLAAVEGQQAELTSWLDRYEADVDEMFARQVGQNESLQGPDQERERTYKLAEKLTDRLDEMGKNITGMIEAINDASANLSKSSKADDPLSHIVRVLNSHLVQLQWIDQNAELLQAKVSAAQKLGQTIGSNGLGSQESDLTDAFYRSYMGRR